MIHPTRRPSRIPACLEMPRDTRSPSRPPGQAAPTAGFTLVELLVVLAIMAILLSLVLVSISGTKGSRDLANATYSIQGALEQARTYAMAENTYTWVGFFEENPNATSTIPAPAGVGQVVLSIVASASGTNPVTPTAGLRLTGLTQVSKLIKLPNVHLDAVPAAAVARPALAAATPADLHQLGSADFPNPATNSWNFLYPRQRHLLQHRAIHLHPNRPIQSARRRHAHRRHPNHSARDRAPALPRQHRHRLRQQLRRHPGLRHWRTGHPLPAMKKPRHAVRAFSLVEVTIALGITVFCLLTVIGLLAVGVNSTHVSSVQTSAANILTAVASDLEADPNITPSFSPTTAKGGTAGSGRFGITTPLYGIQLPVGGAGATSTVRLYLGENGQTNSTAAASLYQLNIWFTANNTNTQPIHQETYARLLITWPATAPYASAQGYVENVVAINRT